MLTRREFVLVICGLSLASLTGCGKEESVVVHCEPQPIHDGDECAVCGMYITEYPGPKAQVCLRDGRVLKFCSTNDLFVWALQPDSVPQLLRAYVHDMAQTDWERPSDDAFIEADIAVFVTDTPLQGAMGPALVSFGSREAAETFMQEHGGRAMAYSEVDWDTLNELVKRGFDWD